MSDDRKPYHCVGCRHIDGPIRTDWTSEESCCTCCHDGRGNRGHGRNDGGGY